MLYAKTRDECFDLRESMIYPNCYDIFNEWSELRIKKHGVTVLCTGIKIIADLGERCLLTDRYGFCVTHHVEVQNVRLRDDECIGLKLINRTNRDVIVPYGEIIAQVMTIPIDMIGR
jgi:dUTPase